MATSKNVQCVVITPERQVLDVAADSVTIPAHDGELGVLPGRAPLMCELGVGRLHYDAANKTHSVFIDGGFAQVHDNRVTVLSPHAAASEGVTPEMIAEAQTAADNEPTGESRTLARKRVTALRSVQSHK